MSYGVWNMEENNEMSLFEKDATVSQSATNIVRLLVLQRYDHMIRSWEVYNNANENSGLKQRARVRFMSSLQALVAMLRPRWSGRKKSEYDLEKINKFLKEDNSIGIDEAVDIVLGYLENDLKLTKLDTRTEYDRTDVELENTMRGL